MKHTFMLAAFAATLAAVPAQAQPVAADLLPAYEVTTIIASMGMRPVGRPAWARGRYVVAAIDRYGREVNVVLDARDGQVIAVRPLPRYSFGAPPPPGYPAEPAPRAPMDGRAPPPAAGPGSPPARGPDAPPPDEDEFFDNDRQQGSLPPRPPARTAAPPRGPSATGSIARSVPVERRDATGSQTLRQTTPVPRPRPALAKANDKADDSATAPSKPVDTPATAAAAASAKAVDGKPGAAKDAKPGAKEASAPPIAKPDQTKPEAASKSQAASTADAVGKPEAGKREIRVIDLSKPKTTAKPEDKPGEAIRF